MLRASLGGCDRVSSELSERELSLAPVWPPLGTGLATLATLPPSMAASFSLSLSKNDVRGPRSGFIDWLCPPFWPRPHSFTFVANH
jgi:hypothetical protein